MSTSSLSVKKIYPQQVESQYIRWFAQISMDDVAIVGGKNASLGEMYRELSPRGIRIPNGFATTADAYRTFLTRTGLQEQIASLLMKTTVADVESLHNHGVEIRNLIKCAYSLLMVILGSKHPTIRGNCIRSRNFDRGIVSHGY